MLTFAPICTCVHILHCRMTNYELPRWLVETWSRDVGHNRTLHSSACDLTKQVKHGCSCNIKYVVPRLTCHHPGCALVLTCQPRDSILECSNCNRAPLVQCCIGTTCMLLCCSKIGPKVDYIIFTLCYVFQIQRHGDWNPGVRARDRSHFVGQFGLWRQRDVDSWLSSQRMGCSELLRS